MVEEIESLVIVTKLNIILEMELVILRSSRPEVFLRKGVLKICRKFTGEKHAGNYPLKISDDSSFVFEKDEKIIYILS